MAHTRDMIRLSRSPIPLAVAFSCLSTRVADASSNRFQYWEPQAGLVFPEILHNNCSAQYQTYLDSSTASAHESIVACDSVISCILGASSQRQQAVLNAASILLGLTPTILILLGPSTAERALLALYRPLLASFINLGSPAQNPLMGTNYNLAVEEYVKEQSGRAVFHQRLSPPLDVFAMIVEFVLAGGAVAITLEASWEMGWRSVSVIFCEVWYVPLLWVLLSLVMLAFGVGGVLLKWSSRRQTTLAREEKRTGCQAHGFRRWMRNEFSTCGNHRTSVFVWRNDSIPFVVVTWFTSLLSTAHLLYGTYWFSTLTFITPTDAILIVARFAIAAIVCRIVCMYELSGLRHVLTFDDQRSLQERRDGGL